MLHFEYGVPYEEICLKHAGDHPLRGGQMSAATMERYDVVIIARARRSRRGGGSARRKRGASSSSNAIRTGGILTQCIHDGFGIERFSAALTGPEYIGRFLPVLNEPCVTLKTSAMALKLTPDRVVQYADRNGLHSIQAGASSLPRLPRTHARCDRHRGHGPAGIYTAGVVQRLVNIENVRVGIRAGAPR
jgi:hypothetical protein